MIAGEQPVADRNVTLASHRHGRGQLSLAIEGALQVEVAGRTWTVPPGRVVWIPPDLEHAERMSAGSRLHTIRIDPDLTRVLSTASRTLQAGPLLRALIARIIEQGGLDAAVPEHVRLAHVLVDEIAAAADVPLEIAAPRDPRALLVARMVEDNPGERRSIPELARAVGVTRRTLERLFMADLGMSVGEWRQRLRLHHALRLLAAERPIAEVARESGWASAPSFIVVFKRHFGVTPHQYRRR